MAFPPSWFTVVGLLVADTTAAFAYAYFHAFFGRGFFDDFQLHTISSSRNQIGIYCDLRHICAFENASEAAVN